MRTAGIVLWFLAVALVAFGTWRHHRQANPRIPRSSVEPAPRFAPVSPEEMWR